MASFTPEPVPSRSTRETPTAGEPHARPTSIVAVSCEAPLRGGCTSCVLGHAPATLLMSSAVGMHSSYVAAALIRRIQMALFVRHVRGVPRGGRWLATGASVSNGLDHASDLRVPHAALHDTPNVTLLALRPGWGITLLPRSS